MKNNYFDFYLNLLAFSTLIFLLISPLFREGLFLDGLTYAAIAKNMANNKGTLWQPFYTESLFFSFYEHPPLGLYLQSLFFKVLKNTRIVVGFYNLIHFLFSIFIIHQTLKHFITDASLKRIWILLFSWQFLALTIWTYKNNMLEVTFSSFILLCFFFLLKSISSSGTKRLFLYMLASSSMLFAFLTKGPVSLFPAGTIFLWYLIFKSKQMIKATCLSFYFLITLCLTSFIFFYFNPDALKNINEYLTIQLLSSLSGERGGLSWGIDRFFILWSVISRLSPLILITIILWQKKLINKEHYKPSLFFLMIALLGTLPICLSPRQSGFYAIPAYFFYLLSFLCIATSALTELSSHIKTKQIYYTKKISIIIFISSIIYFFSFINIPNRNKELIHDLNILKKYIPKDTKFQISKKLKDDWGLHAYIALYLESSLFIQDQDFLISYKNDRTVGHSTYKKIAPQTKYLQILEKLKTNP